jgi:hypothetical protein
MKQLIAFLRSTGRSLRRHTTRLIAMLQHRGSLRISVTVFLPPFIRITFGYTAEIGSKANKRP